MKKTLSSFWIISIVSWCCCAFAFSPSLEIYPDKVIQGEPVMIVVEGVAGLSDVKKISFDGNALGLFLFKNKPSAFVGIDLNKKPGEYILAVKFSDGSVVKKAISIGKREKIEAPLGIPEKLGGNTPTAAKQVVSNLSKENALIYSVRTFPKTLWSDAFVFPISNPIITDDYGYSRQTVGQSITHKGTDFRAKEGAVVGAMNRGIVRFARTLTVYGKTVIIDHGQGLFTIYMHLSKIKVNEGELVKKGQMIGLSGKTGYAESPHLHVSVWIDKVSIDPIKFFGLVR